MSTPHRTTAKILQHSTGLGAPDASLVRRRAGELARIAGREEFTDEDWRQAKEDLHGGHDFSDNGHAESRLMVSEHDMIATDVGHHAERMHFDDEHVAEELIAEGMDEADHEQRLAARDLEQDELAEEI